MSAKKAHPPPPEEREALLSKGARSARPGKLMGDGYRTIGSSMWFQSLIYYNTIFSIVYFVVGLVLLNYRISTFHYESTLVVFLNIFMFLIWTIGELFRLSVAYLGNIQEQVPLLAASLLGTFIATAPSLLYLTFQPENKLPFDYIGGVILIAFCAVETVFNIYSLHRTIDFQTAKFFRLTREHDD